MGAQNFFMPPGGRPAGWQGGAQQQQNPLGPMYGQSPQMAGLFPQQQPFTGNTPYMGGNPQNSMAPSSGTPSDFGQGAPMGRKGGQSPFGVEGNAGPAWKGGAGGASAAPVTKGFGGTGWQAPATNPLAATYGNASSPGYGHPNPQTPSPAGAAAGSAPPPPSDFGNPNPAPPMGGMRIQGTPQFAHLLPNGGAPAPRHGLINNASGPANNILHPAPGSTAQSGPDQTITPTPIAAQTPGIQPPPASSPAPLAGPQAATLPQGGQDTGYAGGGSSGYLNGSGNNGGSTPFQLAGTGPDITPQYTQQVNAAHAADPSFNANHSLANFSTPFSGVATNQGGLPQGLPPQSGFAPLGFSAPRRPQLPMWAPGAGVMV